MYISLYCAKYINQAGQHDTANILLLAEQKDNLKLTYKHLHKNFKDNPGSVFGLPTFKKILPHLGDVHGQYTYQGVTLKHFETGKGGNEGTNIEILGWCPAESVLPHEEIVPL